MTQNHHYTGLSSAQVLESRAAHGRNVLTPPPSVPLWRRFLGKFNDPLILILLVAGALSVAISCYEFFSLGEPGEVFLEPAGIFVAILLATGLSFLFEERANRAFAILNQSRDDEPVEVIRDGNTTRVPRRDVVVGDIILLETGAEVPADGPLLEAVAMLVDESSLTGEPVAHKSVLPDGQDKDATFPSNEVLRGTKVMEGHGVMRAARVGDATENGKVSTAAQIDSSVKTPLNEQLERLGALITRASYAIAALIVVGRLLVYGLGGGFAEPFVHSMQYVLSTLMIAVTLVVVAVPEGLPMAVTLSLAYSMRRMLKTNNLVRRMHACETMGATTVICTDKTGTLTENRMSVAVADLPLSDATRAALVEEGMAVNSTARLDLSHPGEPQVVGNPTEGALLLWLRGRGADYGRLRDEATVISEVPFSTERKFMSVTVRSGVLKGKMVQYIKGAPEIVYAMCRPLPDAEHARLARRLLACQRQAMRTLGFACLVSPDGAAGGAGGGLPEFLGIVGIADPVRREVPAAVRECLDAGIQVKIVTGDTPATACEIGRQTGVWTATDGDRALITGPELERLTDAQLDARVMDLKVIARARPMDKKRLVESLQRKGQVVAVTGDGTNDAPALKAAHVGLSMGDGTSVAKEASDITIVDNSFRSIGRAVMWGRSLYQNIQRFILFQLTVNVAACLIVLAGAFMGTQSPLTVTQMLWVNLIMDTFAAMALASLPPSERVMRDKPRDRRRFIITRAMAVRIIGAGGAFFLLLLLLLAVLESHDIRSMADLWAAATGHARLYGAAAPGSPFFTRGTLSPYEESLFFTFFVMLQFWNMFNARAFLTGRSAFRLRGCGGFLLVAALILAGQVAIVSLGGEMFNVTPLPLSDWAAIIALTSVVLWAGEAARALKRIKPQKR